ncbi:MAG: cation:proton antiporter [Candidatus Nanopelagicales bacterium]
MGIELAVFFLIALTVGAICRVRGINPALPLIITGFVVDAIHPDLGSSIHPETVMTYLLAPIVFAAGLNSSAMDLRKVRRTVVVLAVVLVVVSAVVVGFAATFMIAGLSFGVAFCLGAILSPTDAVAASAVAKKVRLPRRVLLIIEGESLANDGTALTVLRIATVIVVAGGVSVMQATQIAAAAVLGGIAVGLIGGWLVTKLISWFGDPVVGNVIGLLVPFVLYEFSEQIGGSGLLTVVIAGVFIAQVTSVKGTSHTFRIQAKAIWGTVTFVLESVAFFLVGAEFVTVWESIKHPNPIVIVYAALGITVVMFLIRWAFISSMALYVYKRNDDAADTKSEILKGAFAITILGVRGPVSVLAAFSIPFVIADGSPFPDRNIVLAVTFVCVIISLIAATFAGPIVKLLKFVPESDVKILAKARTALNNAALIRLDEIQADGIERDDEIDPEVIERSRQLINRRLQTAQEVRKGNADSLNREHQRKEVAREVLKAQYNELGRLQVSEGLPGDIAKQLSAELDHSQETLG